MHWLAFLVSRCGKDHMGVAAYNRGSRAIGESIRRDFAPGREACEARTRETTLRMTIERQAKEIAKLRGNLALVRYGKDRSFRTWMELDAHFCGYRRHAAGMVRRLMDANTEKERQRVKLARCVREHLTPEQWLAWSAEYDQANPGREGTGNP
jgi:hypothetical protein